MFGDRAQTSALDGLTMLAATGTTFKWQLNANMHNAKALPGCDFHDYPRLTLRQKRRAWARDEPKKAHVARSGFCPVICAILNLALSRWVGGKWKLTGFEAAQR